jgi:phosphatidylglycerol---prolipoprotein diacylglyceryl transferase
VDPVLIDTDLLGRRLTVESYDLFMGLAVVVVLLLGWLMLRRTGLPVRRGLLVLALVLVSIPIGARLLNVLSKPDYYADHPDLYLTPERVGFSLMGGLLLATAVGVVAGRRAGIDPWRLADAFAPGLLAGLAVMRVGCFLAGCCFGQESSLPWAVAFPYGSPASSYYQAQDAGESFGLLDLVTAPTVHPTQLYESAACLVIAGATATLALRRQPPGVAFLWATVLFCLARLGNHILRVPSTTDQLPSLAYPVLYVLLIAGAALLLRRRLHEGSPAPRPRGDASVSPVPGGTRSTASA